MDRTPISPLADRMRPKTLEDFFGQEELVGENSLLRSAIATDSVFSMILWGPPGSGKTTLAAVIANQTHSDFIKLSAVESGVKELRAIVERAQQNQRLGTKTILFIDEIHRWNKSQQDGLLPHVETGTITLIGATTENPSFEVNSALISRMRVFVLHRLTEEHLQSILKHALTDKVNGLGALKVKIEEPVIALIANLMYDRAGEEHYNIISALHKSMRGGDGHAAMYWLVRMLEAGEDPTYIARRLLRFAAEDVGLADPFALVLAESVFEACQKIGMPECNVHLSELVIYLSKTKKSVAAYGKAKADVEQFGNLPVPLHIRNAPTKLMKELNYGKGYKYTPLEDSKDQEYLPDELKGRKYF